MHVCELEMESIPKIDLGRISTKNGRIPSEEDWSTAAKEIESALHGIGFAYLINHGLHAETIANAFAESKAFFEMPPSSKLIYAKDTSKGFHGWAQPNQEKLRPDSAYELRESFDFYKGRISWPEGMEGFERTMSDLETESQDLIKKLLRIFAKTLKLEDEEFFIKNHSALDDVSVPSFSTFRALYYPACDQELNIPPGTVRCGEHTDYGMLTLLFQDQMGGLEVKSVTRGWLPAVPISDSILINTGDLLEQWSNGYFPATPHRLLIPETDVKKKCNRFSMVYFIHPDDPTIVEPLNSEVITREKDVVFFEPITAHDHCRRKLDLTYT